MGEAVIVNVHYSSSPPDGFVTVLRCLRDLGATHIGHLEHSPRVPIDHALEEPDILQFARGLAISGRGWTSTLYASPLYSIQVHLAEDNIALASSMLEALGELAEIDFAVCGRTTDNLQTTEDYRIGTAAKISGTKYRSVGPLGLGARTIIGSRVADLMERQSVAILASAAGWRADGQLRIWREPDNQLQRAFAESGAAAIVGPPRGFAVTKGPRWVPPPESPKPRDPTAEHAAIIQRLRGTTIEKAHAARDINAPHLVAPFAELTNINASYLELEGASLPYSYLSGSRLDDAGLVGADLHGAVAQDTEWIEVSLVEADLRWADLTGARMPLSRFDDANCVGIDVTEVSGVEGGDRANFDDAIAVRFAPAGARSSFRDATFRRALLAESNFAEVDLRGAVFDNADLTNAIFRNADLRGASFRGCQVDGAIFDGANLEGALHSSVEPAKR